MPRTVRFALLHMQSALGTFNINKACMAIITHSNPLSVLLSSALCAIRLTGAFDFSVLDFVFLRLIMSGLFFLILLSERPMLID